jgi:D-proline reductase (dithiol) PrdB
MAELSELSLKYRLWLRTYRWRRLDPIPWAPLRAPLEKSRVGLVTTAGLYRPGTDQPFAHVKGGDISFRVIPTDTDVQSLAIGQTSDELDTTGIEADRNLAFPLDRLREMHDAGEIGEIAPVHLSFNGSITAPNRLVADSAPEAAEVFRKEQVDAVLLVPV